MRDDLCTYESDDDDDDSTVAAAAAAAVVDAAEPQPSPLPLGEILPATPPQPVLLTLQPAPSSPSCLRWYDWCCPGT